MTLLRLEMDGEASAALPVPCRGDSPGKGAASFSVLAADGCSLRGPARSGSAESVFACDASAAIGPSAGGLFPVDGSKWMASHLALRDADPELSHRGFSMQAC